MKITERQMAIDYLTSAALVSSMKEIERILYNNK